MGIMGAGFILKLGPGFSLPGPGQNPLKKSPFPRKPDGGPGLISDGKNFGKYSKRLRVCQSILRWELILQSSGKAENRTPLGTKTKKKSGRLLPTFRSANR
jgi:hypothetical protein